MTLAVRGGTAGATLPHSLRHHSVQFYESDTFLANAVANLIAEGLRVGEPAVLIATQAHRNMFAEQIAKRGIDVSLEVEEGRLVLLDASDTLAAFMDGEMPVPEKFFATIAPLLERLGRLAKNVRA